MHIQIHVAYTYRYKVLGTNYQIFKIKHLNKRSLLHAILFMFIIYFFSTKTIFSCISELIKRVCNLYPPWKQNNVIKQDLKGLGWEAATYSTLPLNLFQGKCITYVYSYKHFKCTPCLSTCLIYIPFQSFKQRWFFIFWSLKNLLIMERTSLCDMYRLYVHIKEASNSFFPASLQPSFLHAIPIQRAPRQKPPLY